MVVLVICPVTGLAQEEMTFPKPTKHHAILKQDIGVWDAEILMWEPGSKGEPTRSKGVERNRVMGDGMWLISNFEGTYAGMPFTGHGVTGYDPIKKKYIGTWVDSFTPHMMTLEGTYDAKTKTLTTFTEWREPGSGKIVKGKNVAQYKQDGTRVFTMYMAAPGGGDPYVKVMQMTYHRRK